MNVGGLTAGVCLAVLAALVLWRRSRSQARRIRWQGGEDQVHELRVALRSTTRISAACGVVAAFLCVDWARWRGISPGAAGVVVVLAAACLALPPAVAGRPVVSTYARLRGVTPRAMRSFRLFAAMAITTAVTLCPLAAVLAVHARLPVDFLIVLASGLVASPVLYGIVAPAQAWIVGPARLPADVGTRLSRMSAELGVRVHGRLARARERKVANAMQFGWLPGLRYVVVTDYLLDELAPAEVDACLAHELAHVRHRDVMGRVLRRSLYCTVLYLALLEVSAGNYARLFLALVVAAGAAGYWLAPRSSAGLIGAELAADDLAVTVVGAAVLATALQRLAEVNAIKRDTSLDWDRTVGHPGVGRRIARLLPDGDQPSGAGAAAESGK